MNSTQRLCSAFVLLICAALIGPAMGHDWYPHDCCHDMDCAPVESIAWLAPAQGEHRRLAVTSKHGTAIVRQGVSIRPSKDHRMHVCMKRYDALGEMEINCLFLPPEA
jgi:hypothetical protein